MTAPDRERDRLGPERLLAFSDGVVAIALTLLVLPLAELVPEVAEPDRSSSTIITDNLGPIGSFVLSFAVIARFWSAHHRVFDDAPRVPTLFAGSALLTVMTVLVARSRREERERAARMGSGGTAALLLLILVVTLVAPGLGYWPLLLLLATAPVERLTGPCCGGSSRARDPRTVRRSLRWCRPFTPSGP